MLTDPLIERPSVFVVSAVPDARREQIQRVRKPLVACIGLRRNWRSTELLKLGSRVLPTSLAGANLLRSAIRKDTTIRQQAKSSRRSSAKVLPVESLVDGANMPEVDDVAVRSSARLRVTEADHSNDAVRFQEFEGTRKEPRLPIARNRIKENEPPKLNSIPSGCVKDICQNRV